MHLFRRGYRINNSRTSKPIILELNIPHLSRKAAYSLLDLLSVLVHRRFVVILSKSWFVACLFIATNGYSQITLYADTVKAEQGQVVDIPINIVGFKDILSMQFSLNWDTTVIKFQEVHSYTEELPQFGADGVGIGSASSGNLIVVWFDNSISGISVTDSSSILTVQFEVIGSVGENSSIIFSDTPALIEIVDVNATVIEPDLVNGEIEIPAALSTSTHILQAQNGMRLFQNHPNPFNKNTTIKTSFNTPEWVTFTITDALGKSILKKRFRSNYGTNDIRISKDQLPNSGIYNYTIQSESYQLTKQMILLP